MFLKPDKHVKTLKIRILILRRKDDSFLILKKSFAYCHNVDVEEINISKQ